MSDPVFLAQRLADVERRLRRTRQLVVAVGVALIGAAAGGWARGGAAPDVLRVRGLVVVDEMGRERIVIGAPIVDEPGFDRRSAVTGMVVRDAAGAERFGVGLSADGIAAMGFDAGPAAGRGNRERITMSAASTGEAEFRMLNHRGQVAAHMSLFRDNTVGLYFTDHGPDATVVHRVSAAGDTTVVHRR